MGSERRPVRTHRPAIRKLNHVGVAVADMEHAKWFVANVLGLELVRESTVVSRGRSTAYFAAGEAEIELVEDHDPEAKERSLAGATAVIEHIAFEVDDLDSAMDSLRAAGVAFRGEVSRVGSRRSAWTEPSTSGGIMYQVLCEDRAGQHE